MGPPRKVQTGPLVYDESKGYLITPENGDELPATIEKVTVVQLLQMLKTTMPTR